MSRGLISQRKYNMQKYNEYKSKGICAKCHINKTIEKHVYCKQCEKKAEKIRKQNKLKWKN